ncbi:glycoside hydrolase family 3 N-terminal domain-containing protein [Salinibacterium soli]|uniref:beta-N-acetylhexosaminidase n=1 Tax=Antiquaquibacter soli TaxID=3064523 RepID=A0ABT9BMG6_9MICO|nr:glycoside hydrolase family 3 N-terminal domain-containing protein [Protaetiibacter sp. WY-16]MDO7882226.1 glycoside hydrolase family 3 N-terminal domain-containing protein [Protaetiibacter sp. WY-16]
MAKGGARRSRAAFGAAALVGVLLSGCTAPAAPEPAPAPTVRESPPPVDPVVQYAADRLSTMTLDEKIRSMLMLHLPGLDAPALGAIAAAEGVGGLILMGSNVPDPPEALATLTPALIVEDGLPLLLAIDQEGGVVRRVPTDTAPSAIDLRSLDPSAARDAFATRSAMLARLGVSVNFGIVADVTGDPASFIFDRSMGATAAEAAPRVAAAVEGEHGTVLSTLKHFPGHGAAPGDSHSGIPTTSMGLDEWRSTQEEPFRAGIDAGAELVMMGHLQFDAIDPQPASLSATWVGILRDELGFDGVIITDDLGMLSDSGRADLADPGSNAVRAVAAGTTMLLFVHPVDVAGIVAAIHAAVDDGRIDEALIDDAARRLLELRRTLSGQTGRFVHCFEECQSIIE